MSNDHVAEPFRSLLAAVEPKPAVKIEKVLYTLCPEHRKPWFFESDASEYDRIVCMVCEPKACK